MIFLKSLTFILWNVALGAFIIYSIKWFLFNPKPRKILGVRIPLTPGFLVRKRDWLFNKVRDLLQDFLEQAEDSQAKTGYLHKLEEQIRQKIWEQTAFIDSWKYMPKAWKQKLHDALAELIRNIISKLLRKTIPHFIEKLRVEARIDQFDEQFSIEFIYKYFRKYVYKPVLLFFVAINILIGIVNMIWFLIIV